MRLPILGESDSIGLTLANPAEGWGNRVPVEIAAMTGETPETTHVRFYSWLGEPLPYLETLLERGPFDAVVISATKVGFTVFTADNQVRRILGKRAGDMFKDTANAFDRRTRWRKPPGLKRNINELTHKVTRRIIGQAPVTSARVVAEGYVKVFARLARLEDVRVIVVAAPPIPSRVAKVRPKLVKEVEWFRTTIRDEAKRRHFAHFDAETVLPPPGPERDALFMDEVHKTPELQMLVGRAVAELIVGQDR